MADRTKIIEDEMTISKKDFEAIKTLAERIYRGNHDYEQGGCPDLSSDGKKWEFSYKQISVEVEEVQAILRIARIEPLKPVKSNGKCEDCAHGHGVYGFPYPVIYDCDGCKRPSHKHFLPLSERKAAEAVKPEDVFIIPCGGTISIYIERLKKGMEGAFSHYEASGFVYRVSDGKRICKMSSIGKMHLPGDKRRSR